MEQVCGEGVEEAADWLTVPLEGRHYDRSEGEETYEGYSYLEVNYM